MDSASQGGNVALSQWHILCVVIAPSATSAAAGCGRFSITKESPAEGGALSYVIESSGGASSAFLIVSAIISDLFAISAVAILLVTSGEGI